MEWLTHSHFPLTSLQVRAVVDYAPEVRRLLVKAGWRFERRGKGDHERWTNAATGAHVTVDGKIRSRHTANGILKEAGIGKKL